MSYGLKTAHSIKEKLGISQIGLRDIVENKNSVITNLSFFFKIIVSGKLFHFHGATLGRKLIQPFSLNLANRVLVRPREKS